MARRPERAPHRKAPRRRAPAAVRPRPFRSGGDGARLGGLRMPTETGDDCELNGHTSELEVRYSQLGWGGQKSTLLRLALLLVW